MVLLLDPIVRADIQDAMLEQSRIERRQNALRCERIPIAADGVIDGVALAALRYQSYAVMAPRPLWERVIAGIVGYLTLRKRTPLPVAEPRASRPVTE